MATVNRQVAANNDDAYEKGNGVFDRTYGKVQVFDQASSISEYYRCGGIRFLNVTVPQAAVISAAHIEVYPGTSDDPNCVLYGHDVDSAPDFLTNPNIISIVQRPRTIANVSWVAANIGSGAFRSSPEIKTIIQELVNRPGWSSGSDLVILLIANIGSVGDLDFYAHDDDPTKAAKIQIDYATGWTGKISGVTNPAKIMGVAVAGITKIKGVA